MAKTQSQTGNVEIKKEEQEDCKPTLVLNEINNTRRSSRIAKRTPSVTNNRRLPAQQVKVEEDTDTKSLLQSGSKSSKLPKGQRISQEQINQLVHYIVNDNMSIAKAARKVNISNTAAENYYNKYKNDPEKRIPVPRNQRINHRTIYTQEQIENLIRYINDDKMTVKEASAKVGMSYESVNRYYNKYLEDPNRNIPIPKFRQYYTQDQKNEFIGYVINDKMNITAASKKAKMNCSTAITYYHNYFKVQNPDIPTPSHIATPRCFTQEQINQLISYIVDDKMTIAAASRKANFCDNTAGKYYRQYLIANNMEIPVPGNTKSYSQGKKDELIRHIVDNKMSVHEASKKANISDYAGRKYYRQHLKNHNIDGSIQKHATQEEIDELIGYIVHDKMSILAASKKAKMGYTTAHRHYHQHLEGQKGSGPTRCPRVVCAPKK
jgi:response regulator of citrate/malate metabolism